VTDTNELDRLIGEVDQIEVVESIMDYIVRLAGLTRAHPDLRLGVSTRGTLSLLRVARAYAATEERAYVTPDDVKAVVATVFAHRMALTPEAELRGVRIDKLLADIVDEIPVPRTREQ
jgi:MoxR-like ATPase